jgi:hypothetical protein
MTRDERGVAFPSPVVILSIIAVAMAGIALIATRDSGDDSLQTVSKPSPTTSQTPSITPTTAAPEPSASTTPKKKPAVNRREVYVEVYNNSNVTGMAGRTADKAAGAGWQVVASDNWYGTIPASTVYYPERLAEAARLLARDLGIKRVRTAVDPMRGDRLTVILTADFA